MYMYLYPVVAIAGILVDFWSAGWSVEGLGTPSSILCHKSLRRIADCCNMCLIQDRFREAWRRFPNDFVCTCRAEVTYISC